MRYIDTSVIVAALDPLDVRQKATLRVLEDEEDKLVSELTLTELSSILARRQLGELAGKLGVKDELLIPALLLYIIKRFGIRYVKLRGYVRLPAIGLLHAPMALAIELARDIKMRTLDLLHLAYAKLLKDKGLIDVITTIDEDFKRNEEVIQRKLGIRIEFIEV